MILSGDQKRCATVWPHSPSNTHNPRLHKAACITRRTRRKSPGAPCKEIVGRTARAAPARARDGAEAVSAGASSKADRAPKPEGPERKPLLSLPFQMSFSDPGPSLKLAGRS